MLIQDHNKNTTDTNTLCLSWINHQYLITTTTDNCILFFCDYWLHSTSFLLFIMQTILTTTTIHLHYVCSVAIVVVVVVVVVIIIVSVDQLLSWRLGCRHSLVLLAGGVMFGGLCVLIHAGLGLLTIMMRSNIYINPVWNNEKRTNEPTTVQYYIS